MEELYQNAFSEEEAKQLFPILQDLLNSVGKADGNSRISESLHEKFQSYLPDKTESEISGYISGIIDTMQRNENNLNSLDAAGKKGISREAWFAEATKQALSNESIQTTLGYYETLSETIQHSNEQMYNAIMTNSGVVSRNPNLDGFIAEQHHVQSFNMDAAAKGSPFRAEIVGHAGEQYTRNGIDIVIKDGNGKIVRRYQSKFCKDAYATESAFRHGDYRGQQSLVPEDQLEEIVSNGRKATDVISHDGVSSQPLSKVKAKELQNHAQNSELPEVTFNDYKLKQLALGVGRQAANAALLNSAVTTGVTIAEKAVSGEKITADEVIETALVSGADGGVKAAVSGALIIASERGIIAAIPKGTPVDVVSSIAFIAVENAKIAGKVANGELSATEGLSRMMDVTVSAVTGMSVSFIAGAEIGVAVGLLFTPAVGVAAGFVAGAVGYIAGSKVGQAVSKGIKAVGKAAVSAVKTIGKAVISAGRAVVNTVKSVAKSVISRVRSFFR